MRRKNLRFSASLVPSKLYLWSTLALHSVASCASLMSNLAVSLHLFALAAIACSLCYQLNRYLMHARLMRVQFDGLEATLVHTQLPGVPLHAKWPLAAQQPLTSPAQSSETRAELLPKAWVLPGLVVMHLRLDKGKNLNLPIFIDSMAQDDFRRLKIFILNGPLMQEATPSQEPTRP